MSPWSTGALVVGVALTLAAAFALYRVAAPLRALIATMRRLADGDHAARAAAAGGAAMRQAAALVNVLAEQSDRLRSEEQEHARLRKAAEDAGRRIRASLSLEDVNREAVTAIERSLDIDLAYMHLMEEGRLGLPVGHRHNWIAPADFFSRMTGATHEAIGKVLRDLLSNHASLVVQDLSGPDGGVVPGELRTGLVELGAVSMMATPFGAGDELTGMVVAFRRSRPWTGAEAEAFQSIADDIGGGLHHARLYETERRITADLKALDRARTDFIATFSHDLRTPLTSISGYVELLKTAGGGPLTAAQRQMIDTIDRNAHLLQTLMDDVLTLTTIEVGASSGPKAPVDLADIAAAGVRAIKPAADAAGVSVVTESGGSGLVVAGNTGQLDRVLMNLLSNAVKFTHAGGTVTVSTARDGNGRAVVRIRDTGIGIPEQDLKRLFSKFFRASNARAGRVPGTGLGLSVTRMIIEDHGGEISVESREGAGTTVTFWLPVPEDSR